VSPSLPARALPSTRLVRLLLAVLFVFALATPLVAAPRTARAAGAYTTDYLNLRAGPSAENYIKLVMSPGSWVELLSELGRSGFYKVAYQGQLGYAHSDYLSIGGPAAIDAGWGNTGSARTTSALNLRSGPGLSYAVALVMPEGVGVQLTGAAESGFLGVIFDGLNGWASNEYLTSGDSSSSADIAYTTSSLNLRAGPSVTNGVKLVMPYGAEVALSGEERNGFASVRYDGTSGWASLDYLSSSPPASDGGPSAGTDIVSIIHAAAAAYGQSGDAMLAVAQCESLLNPSAYNPSSGASGLFQFLPGTWASTPWAGQDIFDPVANAQAAAWMWSVGRRGEWVC
jgi:uncharacterized protein YraI